MLQKHNGGDGEQQRQAVILVRLHEHQQQNQQHQQISCVEPRRQKLSQRSVGGDRRQALVAEAAFAVQEDLRRVPSVQAASEEFPAALAWGAPYGAVPAAEPGQNSYRMARPGRRCAGTFRPARAYIGYTWVPSCLLFLIAAAQRCACQTRNSGGLHGAVDFFAALGL